MTTPPETLRVAVADDQQLIRAGFTVLVNSAPDLEIVGEAANGREAVALAQSTRPDVLLMDIRMPELDGIEATRRIVGDSDFDRVRILVLTTFDDDELVEAALRAGASGFLVKDTEPAQLLDAIRTVATGERLLSPAIVQRIIAAVASRPERGVAPTELLETLTERETELVALAAKGLSNNDIADQLHISPATAKTHISRAMIKLHARDRAQLVTIAYETGLVVPGT